MRRLAAGDTGRSLSNIETSLGETPAANATWWCLAFRATRFSRQRSPKERGPSKTKTLISMECYLGSLESASQDLFLSSTWKCYEILDMKLLGPEPSLLTSTFHSLGTGRTDHVHLLRSLEPWRHIWRTERSAVREQAVTEDRTWSPEIGA